MDMTAHPRSEQATLRYLADARQVHDDLRATLTQIAGYALLLMTSTGRPTLAEGAIRGAEAAAAKSREQVRALQVPQFAAHHHHHLGIASEALNQACIAALVCAGPGATDSERDTLIAALQGAVDNLRAVSQLVPGFETVNFGQACCALHAPAQAPAQTVN